MPTPEWEEWLLREEFEPDWTVTEEIFIGMLKENMDISGGSLDVAKQIYRERYEQFSELGISPFAMKRTVEGEVYTETRFAIEGLRGAFNYMSALEIARERSLDRGLYGLGAHYESKILYLQLHSELLRKPWE